MLTLVLALQFFFWNQEIYFGIWIPRNFISTRCSLRVCTVFKSSLFISWNLSEVESQLITAMQCIVLDTQECTSQGYYNAIKCIVLDLQECTITRSRTFFSVQQFLTLPTRASSWTFSTLSKLPLFRPLFCPFLSPPNPMHWMSPAFSIVFKRIKFYPPLFHRKIWGNKVTVLQWLEIW